MKIKQRRIISLNLLAYILFLIPTFKLNLYSENYSTLSLNTRGYLYLLFLGITIGLLLAKETSIITSRKYGIVMFMSLLIGTLIPHHIPYNLQGNLHLVFAYFGFVTMSIITIKNLRFSKLRNIYYLSLMVSATLYLKCGMVNTLSEVIVMTSTLYVNLSLYIKS